MKAMLNLLCALGIAVIASSCSPQQIAETSQKAYELTVQDGAAYVYENHERRKALRQKLYLIQDAVIDGCIQAARTAEFANKLQTAVERVDWCVQYIKTNYPDLVTVQAVEEGRELIDELKAGTPKQPPSELPVGGGGEPVN